MSIMCVYVFFDQVPNIYLLFFVVLSYSRFALTLWKNVEMYLQFFFRP